MTANKIKHVFSSKILNSFNTKFNYFSKTKAYNNYYDDYNHNPTPTNGRT